MLLRLSLGREDAASGHRGRRLRDARRRLADRRPRRSADDPDDGLVVVGTTAFATAVIEQLDRRGRRVTAVDRRPSRPVVLYDTTLRDGTQGENITLSLADKLRVARMLDEYGMPFIEGGWPGSNPKDIEFFAAARSMRWQTAKLAAFGSTRHRSNRPEADPNLRELVAAETPVVTIFGKSWLLHVTEVLGATPGREPGHDRGVGRPSSPTAVARPSTTPSTSSTATRPTATTRCRRCARRARPARGRSSCATPTAAR